MRPAKVTRGIAIAVGVGALSMGIFDQNYGPAAMEVIAMVIVSLVVR